MARTESGTAQTVLLDRQTDEAVAAVTSGDDSPDRQTAHAAVERIAEEGVVTRSALDDALGHASKVVSTPETRVELAGIELDGVRERAAPVADVDVVAFRLDAFADRLEAVESRIEALGEDLQSLLARRDDVTYALARDLHRLHQAANECHHAADELLVDVEEFGRWLASHERRVADLDEDLDALDAALSDLSDAARAVREESPANPGLAWASATLQNRVLGLLVDDVRADAEGIRRLADRMEVQGGDVDGSLDRLDGRLDDLASRRTEIGSDLDDLARDPWIERFGEGIRAFEATVADVEPPVDWARVQETLAAHRSSLGDAEPVANPTAASDEETA